MEHSNASIRSAAWLVIATGLLAALAACGGGGVGDDIGDRSAAPIAVAQQGGAAPNDDNAPTTEDVADGRAESMLHGGRQSHGRKRELHCWRYAYKDLGTLGGTDSAAAAINNEDEVVGYSNIAGSDITHATLWRKGHIIDLDPLGTTASGANDINDRGEIVGYRNGTATLWSRGRTVDLGTLGGRSSTATGINHRGQIVGTYFISGVEGARAVVWDRGVPTDLGIAGGGWIGGTALDISDTGQIVGASSTRFSDNSLATSWTGTSPTLLGGSVDSAAFAVNNAGEIVGMSGSHPNYMGTATVWNGTTPTLLNGLAADELGRFAGAAVNINNAGQIVGRSLANASTSSCCDWHAVVWLGSNPTDLNNLLDTNTVNAGWVLVSASGINDRGSIVGAATNSITGVSHAFMLSAVAVHHRHGAVGPATLCAPSH